MLKLKIYFKQILLHQAYARLVIWMRAIFLLLFLPACENKLPENKITKIKTENIIIFVIDGPRYVDVWGASATNRSPNLVNILRAEGTFFENFYNDGHTYTNPGHTAITTGIHQMLDNNGAELPNNPSIFQYWLQQSGKLNTAAWIITSKGKLDVLGNTNNPDWKNKYTPSLNCGLDGLGNGNRDDSLTLVKTKQILTQYKPNLVLINFKEPDVAGHSGKWNAYLKGITSSDRYLKQFWDYLQKDDYYRNTTTLFITNDHGRHLDGIKDGFISHGDQCEGCKHISLLVLGPDIPKGITVSTRYNQTDISATVAYLLGMNFEVTQGQKIKELLPQ